MSLPDLSHRVVKWLTYLTMPSEAKHDDDLLHCNSIGVHFTDGSILIAQCDKPTNDLLVKVEPSSRVFEERSEP